MFKYFIKDKEVNKQNFQNKVGDYITVLSGDTVSSTLFNSFFAEYEARVTNKDNNKLINRNNPMELNEHLKEVVNKENQDIFEIIYANMSKECLEQYREKAKNQICFNGKKLYDLTDEDIRKNTNSTRHKSKDGETHCEQTSQATYIKTEDLLKAIKEKNKLDDKGTFNLVSKPSEKFKKEQLKTDKVEDKYKPTDCILDEIHTGFFAEKEDDMNRMVEEEIERQEFETKAKHEYTGVLKTTGMFFVWYPKLTGDWEKDKTEYLDIYKILVDMRKTYKEEQANYHQVATDKEQQKGNITTSSYTKPVCKIDPKEYNKEKPSFCVSLPNNYTQKDIDEAEIKIDELNKNFNNAQNNFLDSLLKDSIIRDVEIKSLLKMEQEKNAPKYTYTPRVTKEQFEQLEIARRACENEAEKKELKDIWKAKTKKIGIKNNKNKPSLDIVINKQFPNALQLIALATEYGHNKYLAKDELYDNFRNVEGGSQTYFDAAARHNTDRNGVDNESGLPHIIHASWDFLAGLELWAEENNIDIKDFSENYMKNLNLENAK